MRPPRRPGDWLARRLRAAAGAADRLAHALSAPSAPSDRAEPPTPPPRARRPGEPPEHWLRLVAAHAPGLLADLPHHSPRSVDQEVLVGSGPLDDANFLINEDGPARGGGAESGGAGGAVGFRDSGGIALVLPLRPAVPGPAGRAGRVENARRRGPGEHHAEGSRERFGPGSDPGRSGSDLPDRRSRQVVPAGETDRLGSPWGDDTAGGGSAAGHSDTARRGSGAYGDSVRGAPAAGHGGTARRGPAGGYGDTAARRGLLRYDDDAGGPVEAQGPQRERIGRPPLRSPLDGGAPVHLEHGGEAPGAEEPGRIASAGGRPDARTTRSRPGKRSTAPGMSDPRGGSGTRSTVDGVVATGPADQRVRLLSLGAQQTHPNPDAVRSASVAGGVPAAGGWGADRPEWERPSPLASTAGPSPAPGTASAAAGTGPGPARAAARWPALPGEAPGEARGVPSAGRRDPWPALPDDRELWVPASTSADARRLRRLDREQAGD